MKFHISNPKALGMALTAIVGLLVTLNWIPKELVAPIGAVIAAVAALFAPAEDQ